MITISEASRLLGCSDRTVRRAIKAGTLPARVDTRPGNGSAVVYRLSEADVKDWALQTGRTQVARESAHLDTLPGEVQTLRRENARLETETAWLKGRIEFLERVILALPPARGDAQAVVDNASGTVQGNARRGFWSRFRLRRG